MPDHNLFLVFTNPVAGKEQAFHDWYEQTHVPDVLAVPGVVNAQRFEVAPMETPELEGVPAPPPPAHAYLTVYELARDANEVMAEFLERLTSGAMDLDDSLDLNTIALSVWRPISGRRFAGNA